MVSGRYPCSPQSDARWQSSAQLRPLSSPIFRPRLPLQRSPNWVVAARGVEEPAAASDRIPGMDEQLRELRDIIRKKSLRIGDFTLTSGKKSSYYLDCRTTTLDPRGALLIARLILETIRKEHIQADAIGGLTMGADPIAAAVAVVSEIEGRPINAFIVRKEAKGHGTQR